jgi:hypothetical protein
MVSDVIVASSGREFHAMPVPCCHQAVTAPGHVVPRSVGLAGWPASTARPRARRRGVSKAAGDDLFVRMTPQPIGGKVRMGERLAPRCKAAR